MSNLHLTPATPQDLAAIDRLIKPQAPERIYNWLDTQMSIARHYGGLTYMGHSYSIAFHEAGAPLVRADVLTREAKAARLKARWEKIANAGFQGALL